MTNYTPIRKKNSSQFALIMQNVHNVQHNSRTPCLDSPHSSCLSLIHATVLAAFVLRSFLEVESLVLASLYEQRITSDVVHFTLTLPGPLDRVPEEEVRNSGEDGDSCDQARAVSGQ